MPAQDRARRDQPELTQRLGQQADQRGEHRSIRPIQARLRISPAQHSDLVAQDKQFDILRRRRATEQHQPTEQPDEDQIQQPQRHGTRSCPDGTAPRSPRSEAQADFRNPTANLRSESGSALNAELMHVDGPVFLRNGFAAIGTGESGAVRLFGAQIDEVLSCEGADLCNDSGPALHAFQARVGRSVFFSHGFRAVSDGPTVTVDLTGLQINGTFVFNPARLEHRTNKSALIRMDGMAYAGIPQGASTRDWLRLLREGTPDYAAQPYQQLAAALRAAGHDGDARRILMAQRRDQVHRRALTGRAERTWTRLTGLTLGYGYQPWRALLGLLTVIAIATFATVILGDRGGLAEVQTQPTTLSANCTLIERIGVGLDLGIPLITTDINTHCKATNSTIGQILLTPAGYCDCWPGPSPHYSLLASLARSAKPSFPVHAALHGYAGELRKISVGPVDPPSRADVLPFSKAAISLSLCRPSYRASGLVEQYANNPIESDHRRLKSRLRPMRRLTQLSSVPGSVLGTRSSRTSVAATTNSVGKPIHGIDSRQFLLSSSAPSDHRYLRHTPVLPSANATDP